MSRYFVIKEIGCEDSTPYAVVERRPMLNGPDHLVLFGCWHHTEDQARASAHNLNHPEY